MLSLHSMLAVGGLMESLPMILLIGMGALLAIAFCEGFMKGFRKVGWNGLVWLVAGGMFVLIGKVVPMKGSSPMGTLAIVIAVAIICAGASFLGFGVLAYFLRPKMRWIDDDINGDTSLAEYGLEFEPEYLDYDGEHDYAPYGKRIYKTGYGTPCFAFRLIGGLTCAINIGMILGTVLGAFLMIASVTSIGASFPTLFTDKYMLICLDFAQKYLLEFVAIGVILLLAKMGYNRGLVSSARALLITIGGFGALALSAYLPFSSYGATGMIGTLVERCTGVFTSFGPLNGIFGKLLTSGLLLGFFSALLIVLNVVLKSVCLTIESIQFTRNLDSCFAAGFYMVIGAVICMGVWFAFAVLDMLGIFHVSEILYEGAYLSKGLYEFAVSILSTYLV